jgi:phosphoenolpyruvate synthase/pyruvate phosphate dikinase
LRNWIEPRCLWLAARARIWARLIQHDFPVPTGFVITTQAYETFVDHNQLRAQILTLATESDTV